MGRAGILHTGKFQNCSHDESLLGAIPFSESISGHLFFVVCFFALILFDASATRIRARLTLLLAMLAIIATTIGSVACSLGGFYQSTWFFLQKYIYPIALFLILANAQLKYLNETIVTIVVIVGMIVGVCGAAPAAVYASHVSSKPLYFPGVGSINHSAAYICFAMAALFVAASHLRKEPIPLLSYTMSAAFFMVGFLTRSRGFILSIAWVAGAYLFLLRGKRALLPEPVLVAGGLVIAFAIAALAFGDAFSGMWRPGDFFHGRLEIWRDALTLFSRYPTCGIGLGKFRDTSFNPVYRERGSGEFFHHGHNIFLNSLAEGGLLLFAAVSAVVVAGVVFLILSLRINRQSALIQLSFMTWGVFCVFGILDDTIVPTLTFVPAICFGLYFSFTRSA